MRIGVFLRTCSTLRVVTGLELKRRLKRRLEGKAQETRKETPKETAEEKQMPKLALELALELPLLPVPLTPTSMHHIILNPTRGTRVPPGVPQHGRHPLHYPKPTHHRLRRRPSPRPAPLRPCDDGRRTAPNFEVMSV